MFFKDSADELLNQVPAAIAILQGTDHIYTMVNPLYEQYFINTPRGIIGLKIKEVFPETKYEEFIDLLDATYRSGKVYEDSEFSVEFIENGTVRTCYYDFSIKPLKGDDGVVSGLMIFSIDVTERVTAKKDSMHKEIALKKLHEELNLSVSAGKIGTWNYNAKDNSLNWSKEQLAIYGLAEDEFNNTLECFHSFLYKISLEDFTELSIQSRVGNESIYEFQIQKRDGDIRWIHARSKIFEDTCGNLEFIHGINIDITQQKLVLQQSLENENSLKELANAMPQVVWQADAHGNVIYYNDRIAQFSGAKKNEENIWEWHGILHQDDLKATDDAWINSTITGEDYEKEHRIRMRDGSFRWFLSRAFAQRDQNGKIKSWYGTATDIHDHKILFEELTLAKEEIEKSEVEFRTMANNIAQLSWMTDEKGWIYWYNKRWYDYTGSTFEEMQGWGWQKVHHPDSVESVTQKFKAALEAESNWEDTFRLRSSDGEYRWFLSRAYPVRDKSGKLKGWFGTNTDVTELRNAEEQIRNSESRLKTLAETLPQLVWVTNAQGVQQFASGRWEEYTGIHPRGIETWLEIIHPEDIGRISENWKHSLDTGDKYSIEIRLKGKDGVYRWFYGTGEAVKNDCNEIINWIGSFTNIHKQKESAQQLELLVEERTLELKEKNIQLELTNKELESYNYIASHDLQEPLRKIRVFLDLLEASLEDPVEREKYIIKIHKSASRMSSLIQAILVYNSLSKTDRDLSIVDINEIFQNIIVDFELLIQEKNATILFENLGVVYAKRYELQQLFSNLLSNSLKFSKGNPIIEVTSQINDEHLIIIFKDNGIGFSNEYSELVFRLFQRLHTQHDYSGSGIGLGIVKKVVDNYNGKILVDSIPNVGTTFTIYFPKNLLVTQLT